MGDHKVVTLLIESCPTQKVNSKSQIPQVTFHIQKVTSHNPHSKSHIPKASRPENLTFHIPRSTFQIFLSQPTNGLLISTGLEVSTDRNRLVHEIFLEYIKLHDGK